MTLAESMTNIEYKNRVLVSINFMGRKSEVSSLKYSDIEFRNNEKEMWIKLPQTKLNSSEKVPVEVFKFVKKHFEEYLRVNTFGDNDLLFPSKEPAFAKNLRIVSEKLFKKRISPKTLRKIGVCVAEQLGYNRSDVERIGGWSANSPVLSHYFKRKGVSAKVANAKASKELDKDVYVELDRMKVKEDLKDKQIDSMRAEMKEMNKLIHFLSGRLGAVLPNLEDSDDFVKAEKDIEVLHRAKKVK
jgi:integrase